MGWRKDGGFTLVELMITCLVLAIIVPSVYVMLVGGTEAYVYNGEKVDNQQGVRAAMNTVLREVRAAKQVYDVGAAFAVIDSIRYDAGALNLFLTDLRNRTIVFYWKNHEIRRSVKDSGGMSFYGHNAVAYGIPGDGLSFGYSGVPPRTVAVTIKGTGAKGREFKLSSKATLRFGK